MGSSHNPIFKSFYPLFLSLLSGVSLTLVFPKFDFEILAWVALVPLLHAIKDQTPQKSALYGFVGGTVFYLGGLSWINNTLVDYGHLAPALGWLVLAVLAAYLGGYVALFCYVLTRFAKGKPFTLLALSPFLWTALEYFRSTHQIYGFSWLGLGYSQFKTLTVIQMADITGVYGISALIVLVNVGVYLALQAYLGRTHPAPPFNPKFGFQAVGIALAVWLLCWVYGTVSLSNYKNRTGPSYKVGLTQGNIDQNRKWDPIYRHQVMAIYRTLTIRAVANKPDLIVWPEAATPFFYSIDKRDTEKLNTLVKQVKVPLLFGSPYKEGKGQNRTLYNRAFLVTPDGNIQGTYDKRHLVPFGEFVPFRKLLFFVKRLVAMVGDFGRGEVGTVFDLNGTKFGVSICYEVTFPDEVRMPVKNGANFLVNITNDAWFGRSAASYQHMGMAALRAVENRVPIVRSANTGISGVIEPTGAMRQTTGLYVKDLVNAEIIPNRNPNTFYSQYGDVFAMLCWVPVFVLLIGAYRSERSGLIRSPG